MDVIYTLCLFSFTLYEMKVRSLINSTVRLSGEIFTHRLGIATSECYIIGMKVSSTAAFLEPYIQICYGIAEKFLRNAALAMTTLTSNGHIDQARKRMNCYLEAALRLQLQLQLLSRARLPRQPRLSQLA